MKRYLLCLLSTYSFFFFFTAHAEDVEQVNVVGVDNSRAKVCTPEMLDALRIEITMTLCLAKKDPICQYAYFSSNRTIGSASDFGRKKGLTGKGSYDEFMRQVTSPERIQEFNRKAPGYLDRLFFGNQKIFANNSRATEQISRARSEIAEMMNQIGGGSSDDEALSFIKDMTDAGVEIGSLIPGYVGTAASAFKLANALFGEKDEPPPAEDQACVTEGENFIPARNNAEFGRCVASPVVFSKAANTFLAQPRATQAKRLKVKATCAYYNQLLLTLHSMNRGLIHKLVSDVDKSSVRCSGEGGAEFKWGTQPEVFDVKFNSQTPTAKMPRLRMSRYLGDGQDPLGLEYLQSSFVKAGDYTEFSQIRSKDYGKEPLPIQNAQLFKKNSNTNYERLGRATLASSLIASCCDQGRDPKKCLDEYSGGDQFKPPAAATPVNLFKSRTTK